MSLFSYANEVWAAFNAQYLVSRIDKFNKRGSLEYGYTGNFTSIRYDIVQG